ncbi:MAG: hypothetical protein ACYCR3_11505 [Acidithiobacillus sp.]
MEALHPGRHRLKFAITIADREDAVFPGLGWMRLTAHPFTKKMPKHPMTFDVSVHLSAHSG